MILYQYYLHKFLDLDVCFNYLDLTIINNTRYNSSLVSEHGGCISIPEDVEAVVPVAELQLLTDCKTRIKDNKVRSYAHKIMVCQSSEWDSITGNCMHLAHVHGSEDKTLKKLENFKYLG